MLSRPCQPRGESRFIIKVMMEDKDYDKYVYFVCRPSKFAIVIKGTKKKIVEGEVVYEEGLRLDFNNKMLRIEKTEENKELIKKIREKLKKEENQDPKRRSFFEETRPIKMLPEEKVIELVGKKNDRIEELEAENKRLKEGIK